MLDFVMASIAFMLAVSTISYFFPGCTARGLSFSSKTFTKMLQSCPHQCDLHKVILEAEERYKKELRQLAVCNNSRYATHESNYDFFFSSCNYCFRFISNSELFSSDSDGLFL